MAYIIKLTYIDSNIKTMDKKKINHIETSSRASSAVNFNSIEIDLGSNFDLAVSNHGFPWNPKIIFIPP